MMVKFVCLLLLSVSMVFADGADYTKINFTQICKEVIKIHHYSIYSSHEVYVTIEDNKGELKNLTISKSQFKVLEKYAKKNVKELDRKKLQKNAKYITDIVEYKTDGADVIVKCIKTDSDGGEWEMTFVLGKDEFAELQKIVKNNKERDKEKEKKEKKKKKNRTMETE